MRDVDCVKYQKQATEELADGIEEAVQDVVKDNII